MTLTNGCRVRAIAVLSLSLISIGLAAAHALDELIAAVIRQGPESQLPAHLSVVLGVSRVEQPTAVKQAVMRDGTTVRTFNVCTSKQEDVVFITYNETSKASKVYLVSPAGVLRKAVAYQPGAAAVERSSAEAAGDFAVELKFWTDFQHRSSGSK